MIYSRMVKMPGMRAFFLSRVFPSLAIFLRLFVHFFRERSKKLDPKGRGRPPANGSPRLVISKGRNRQAAVGQVVFSEPVTPIDVLKRGASGR